MSRCNSIGALALAAVLVMPAVGAQAWDDSKYPDFSGQWRRPDSIGVQWDQTKPLGLGPGCVKTFRQDWMTSHRVRNGVIASELSCWAGGNYSCMIFFDPF